MSSRRSIRGEKWCLPSERRSFGSCMLRPGEKTMCRWGEQGRGKLFSFGSPTQSGELLPRLPGSREGPLARLLLILLRSRPVPGRRRPQGVRGWYSPVHVGEVVPLVPPSEPPGRKCAPGRHADSRGRPLARSRSLRPHASDGRRRSENIQHLKSPAPEDIQHQNIQHLKTSST